MAPRFCGAIAADLLYDPDHDMWVRLEGGEVVVGVSAFGVFQFGEIIAFTAKPKGATVARGRGLGTVESAKTVFAVHAPLSFAAALPNAAAEAQPQRIGADPYGAGWMMRGRPLAWDAEARLLVDAAAYRAHVLRMAPDALIEDAA